MKSIVVLILLFSAVASAEDTFTESVIRVPSRHHSTIEFETTVFTPPTLDPKAPIVLINHGTSPGNVRQNRSRPMSAVRFFTHLGWLVIVPNRRGYAGSSGTRVRIQGCDMTSYGLENASDVDDVVEWLQTQSVYAQRKLIVIGQSTGGLTTMAYSSLATNRASAMINFHGGMRPSSPTDCLWQARLNAFAQYASTSHPMSLWVYTANDHSSNPAYIQKLQSTFTAHGGSVELHQLPAYKDDGHYLFGDPDGEAIWEPLVMGYLKSLKIIPARAVQSLSH